jgi:amino acid adenylation domain-containing protein
VLKEAKNNPNQIIIKDKWRSWTWNDIIKTSYRFSEAIRNNYPLSQKPVAIPLLVGRSGKVISAILGCLITENAFAPLSIKHPSYRIKKSIELLNADHVLSALDESESISDDLKSMAVFENENSSSSTFPNNAKNELLYVLFTSGSTGEPKGVLCSHLNIMNTILWSEHYLDWKKTDIIGCATQFSFDISMFDVFSLMYHGVPMVIFPEPSNTKDVVKRILSDNVTSIFSVPSFFSQFVTSNLIDELNTSKLRRIISGGDFFPPMHVSNWMKKMPQISVYNAWGPTETSMVNTMHKITADDLPKLKKGKHPPIGKQHSMMPLILVDKAGKIISEPNVAGELVLLGVCVSMGYLNDDKEMKRRYTTKENLRAFLTGDIGYFDEKENFYISGRSDSMVKISGHRIDLNEVENVALQHLAVSSSAAFVQTIQDDYKELWLAMELKESNSEIDIYSAKKLLRKILPQYMVPKRLFVIPKIPLTINRKVDRLQVKQIINEKLSK